jgi:hypothetical protein
LLQQQGAEDFFWQAKMVEIDRNEKAIDIHHIFPRKWFDDRNISPRIYNSIVNKTAISYKANRKIGGQAPSDYLVQIQRDKAVQQSVEGMDQILQTHCISPRFLRNDDFTGFYEDRKATLLKLVENAMGKASIATTEVVTDDHSDDDVDDA